VQEALDCIVDAKKVTTIIIAHRLSTIRNVDRIHVITSGVIAESGSHDELMRSQGYYYRLVQKQDAPSEPVSRSSSGADMAALGATTSQSPSNLTDGKDALIEFRDVVFSYPTRPTKKVFDKFSLKIREGETIALVGPSVRHFLPSLLMTLRTSGFLTVYCV
jgi:ABC-type multidrug transport system fused ATPase/permease subunit